jgi:hypothetical protein
MAGLVPAINVFGLLIKTWMPGATPGVTKKTFKSSSRPPA